MNSNLLLAIALAASILSFAGCDHSRTSDHQDGTPGTAAKSDQVKQEARVQKDAVDTEAARLMRELDSDERRIRDRYKADRQEFANASDNEATGNDAKKREIEVKAKHDKEAVDAEAADELKTSPSDKSAEIQADADGRKAAIDSEKAESVAPLSGEADRRKAKQAQRGLDIDRRESDELGGLEKERAKIRNDAEAKKLKIDKRADDELAELADDSSSASR